MSKVVRWSLAAVVALTAGVWAVLLIGVSGAVALAPGSDQDLVFSIDGSGSIDAADFDTEKRAIEAALHSPDLFQLDGTTRIGVVQWAGGVTRTEVPMTRLSSSADLVAATDAIDAMSQLGGGTNAGEGIQAAAALLSGGAAARQTICVTTDGTSNTGISPADAADAAVAQGVDRIAFATLEDPGSFDEATAHGAYNAVARDAEVVHSRTPSEFSAVLPSACLRPAVTAVGFEATQGVQNWNDTVPVVADRKMFVRAFLQPSEAGLRFPYGARLRGYRGIDELPESPLVAINSGGQVSLSGGVAARRRTPDASLNFALPDSWLSGNVQLRLDGVGAAVTCNAHCGTDVAFRAMPELDLKMVGMPYFRGLSVVSPSDTALDEQAGRIFSALPVPDVSYGTARMLPVTSAPSEEAALRRLRIARTLDGCWGDCHTLYYGALEGTSGGGVAAGIPGNTAVGYIGTDRYSRNRAAHEVGHLLGRPHAVRGAATGTPPQKIGACGEVADGGAESFPYFTTSGGRDFAALGPLGSTDTENWGLDVRFFPSNANLGVISPEDTPELMSYCNLPGSQGRWTSAHTWSSIVDARVGQTGGGGGGGGGGWDLAAGDLAVQGTVDTATSAVTLDPVTLVRSGYDATVPAGDYTLVERDAAGTVLASTPFAIEPLDPDAPAPGQAPADTSLATFAVPIEPNAALSRIEITHAGSVLLQRSASAHAPTVTVTSPKDGESLSGDVGVTWTGADEDDDTLSYTVQYSADDGEHWTTVSPFQKESRITIPAATLAGSTRAAIKVVASDGMRSSAGAVRFLTVPDNAPSITILSPAGGDVVSGAQNVVLSATARDLEDGALSDAAISWTSDRDGALGTGASLTVPADSLTEGVHVLTATATDSAGRTATATVTITVRRIAAPNNQPPVIGSAVVSGPVSPGQTATLTVSFNDPDAGDAHTVTIDWGDGSAPQMVPAAVGTTEVSATHAWSAAGTYTVAVTVDDGTESVTSTTIVSVTTPAPAASPTVTKAVTGTADLPQTRLMTPRLTTKSGSHLLVAYISVGSLSRQSQSVSQVTGGGLTWTRVARKDSAGGATEVWQAYTKKPVNDRVTARTAQVGTGTITVVAYAGAATKVGESAAAGTVGRNSSVTVRAAAGSLVWAVGLDPRSAAHRVIPRDQQLMSEVRSFWFGDTYWVQRMRSPAAQSGVVKLSAIAPRSTPWQMVAVEVPPAGK